MNRLHSEQPITLIIHGDASGADRLGEKWARANAVKFKRFPAAWDDLTMPPVVLRYRNGKPYNAAAGGTRNQQMLEDGWPDLVLAFPGHRGTQDMIGRARRRGFKVTEIKEGDEAHGN